MGEHPQGRIAVLWEQRRYLNGLTLFPGIIDPCWGHLVHFCGVLGLEYQRHHLGRS